MTTKHTRLPILSAVAISILLTGCGQKSVSDESSSSARSVQVMELKASNLTSVQRFSGIIQSQYSANLAFRVPGTVDSLLVKEGDRVKKGQVLARLDPHDFQVTVNQAQAQLSEAMAAYKLSKVERQRTQQATSDNAIAHINLDRAQSAETRSEANVALAKQDLIKAQDALRYTELKAPFDGVVAKRFIDEHEQSIPGIKVMTIHQPNKLEVVANVPERKLHLIQSGMKVNVSWFDQDKAVTARVNKIASIPDALNRTYDVNFNLSKTPEYIFPGKAVSVDLTTSDLSNNAKQTTFCVPSLSVISSDSNNYIVKVIESKAQWTPVSVQSALDDQLCVSGDIKLGNTIVTAGSSYVNPGDSLNILDDVRG